MRTSRLVNGILVAIGLTATIAPAVAQSPYPYERSHLRKDQAKADHLRADIARDREKMERARYQGKYREAEHHARELARDQGRLDAVLHDIQFDQRRFGFR